MSDRPLSARPVAVRNSDSLPERREPVSAASLWRQEGARLVGIGMLGAAFGWLLGRTLLGASLGLGLYALWQVRHLVHLRLWLQRPKHYELPEPVGLWGEVFDGLLDLQRKNRKKKKKLAAMLAEFQASTAALPDGAVVLGKRGEIVWFNTAARRLLGLRLPQDVGIRVPNLLRHPAFTRFFDAGQFDREVEMPSPVNQARTVSLRVIPYGQQQKLLIVRDISERLMLDAARRDFVANASHELRTPLTVLRGYLDMMEIDARDAGALTGWHAPLLEMRNQALRMEALINDMLKLARLESGRVQMREELLDAPALIRRVIDDARQLSKDEHRFETVIDAGLWVSGGEVELHSIFANLVNNAVRYTPTGGVIRIGWAHTAQGARFSVADSGIGIAQQDIPRLTERFYRVDIGRSRASGGTGLGLSIVKHALEAFDSHLEIESEIGVGSTFSCVFPPQRAQRAPEMARPSASAGY